MPNLEQTEQPNSDTRSQKPDQAKPFHDELESLRRSSPEELAEQTRIARQIDPIKVATIVEKNFPRWDTDGDQFLNQNELKAVTSSPESSRVEAAAAEFTLLHFDDIRKLASHNYALTSALLSSKQAEKVKERITEETDLGRPFELSDGTARLYSNKISKNNISALITAHDDEAVKKAVKNIGAVEDSVFALASGRPSTAFRKEVARIKAVVSSWDK